MCNEDNKNTNNCMYEILKTILVLQKEANKLVELLGGKKNIISIDASLSRFKVTLRDVSLANKEGIQKLGAKGIVEIDDQLKIVFDTDAVKLKKCIDDLMKQNATK